MDVTFQEVRAVHCARSVEFSQNNGGILSRVDSKARPC